MIKSLLLSAIALVLVSGLAMARSNNNDPDANKYKIASIQWIKDHLEKKDLDDKHVVLIGKIVKKVGGDEYILDDGTGQLQVSSDEKLPIGKRVVLRGDVDEAVLDVGTLELDVQSWRLERQRD